MIAITHNGTFHADDVIAAAILLTIYPNCKIIRSRNQEKIKTADIVFDIGGIYDPLTNKFDHHINPIPKGMDGYVLSSAGMLWNHFATKLVSNSEVWSIVREKLIRPIDLIDNGTIEIPKNIATISGTISEFNPSWDSNKSHDAAFFDAVKFATGILQRQIANTESTVKAKEQVRKAISASADLPYIILNCFMPWQKIVIKEDKNSLFMVFPDISGTWRVQTIPNTEGSFNSRKDLPKTWAGLRGNDFCKAANIKDGIFCHPNRFICGTETRESAIKLAEIAAK